MNSGFLGITFDSLQGHAGSIVSVLNIEFEGTSLYSSVGLHPIGVNGRLANADLITTAYYSIFHSNIPVVIQDGILPQRRHGSSWEDIKDSYLANMGNLMSFIKVQALGFSNYGHSLFALYNIEALSLTGLVGTSPERVTMIDVGM